MISTLLLYNRRSDTRLTIPQLLNHEFLVSGQITDDLQAAQMKDTLSDLVYDAYDPETNTIQVSLHKAPKYTDADDDQKLKVSFDVDPDEDLSKVVTSLVSVCGRIVCSIHAYREWYRG